MSQPKNYLCARPASELAGRKNRKVRHKDDVKKVIKEDRAVSMPPIRALRVNYYS